MVKLYTVNSHKPIIGMGGINGPLSTPTPMNYNDVQKMVKMGYEIYQVNPFDHTEKVKVTKTNIRNIHFKISRVESALKEAKIKEEVELSKPLEQQAVVINKEEKSSNESNKNNNYKSNKSEKINKPDKFSK